MHYDILSTGTIQLRKVYTHYRTTYSLETARHPDGTAELRSDIQLFRQACSVRCQRFEVVHVETLVSTLQIEQLHNIRSDLQTKY